MLRFQPNNSTLNISVAEIEIEILQRTKRMDIQCTIDYRLGLDWIGDSLVPPDPQNHVICS